MLSHILNKIAAKLRPQNQIRETFIHPSIYRAFDIWCDPVTTTVAIPFTPARGTEKVVDYILRGIAFKDQPSKDAAMQAITDLIYNRSSDGAKIEIPMGDHEYVIVLNFESHPLW